MSQLQDTRSMSPNQVAQVAPGCPMPRWTGGQENGCTELVTGMPQHHLEPRAQYDAVALMHAFDRALERALPRDQIIPTHLHSAMRHAVLNGGKRIRPRFLFATAEACNGGPMDQDTAELVLRAAVAAELIHSASLVHDDLRCSYDASLRRGKPTVHCAYSVPIVVLAGDALITQAFEILADYEGANTRQALRLSRLLAQATGSSRGIIGGQSLELEWEPMSPGGMAMEFVQDYHEKKSAALFDYSMRAAAISVGCGQDAQDRWGDVGTRLGLAFQLIDDLLVVHVDEEVAGRTTVRDQALQRPNAALTEATSLSAPPAVEKAALYWHLPGAA